MTRRRFLSISGGAAATALTRLAHLAAAQPPIPGGRVVKTLPLGDPRRRDNPPLDRLLGDGLDARLFADLSDLAPGRMVTAADRFFIRTACPEVVDGVRPWTITLGGRVRAGATLSIATLQREAAPVGTHLLECAGNTNPNNFGLMSAAEWQGVPIAAALDRVAPLDRTSRILITGVDDEQRMSLTSVPGASWIFSREDLERAGAFLATHMDGAPLSRHHGAPVRLVVPGWYACTCIKWVNRVDWVDADAEPTSQMLEFAERTHQPAGVRIARDFAPATIDVAAMPIRVEQWDVGGRPLYRVVGIVWGGATRANALQIRFRTEEAWVDIGEYDPPKTTSTWSLWSHQWRPAEPGRYYLVVRAKDPGVPTRRLDLFFYVRAVDITDV